MPWDSSRAIPLKGPDDNHSIEMLVLLAEPKALGCLCNSAPAHWVTPGDTIHRGSSQTGGSREPKRLWGYESLSLILHHTVGLAMLSVSQVCCLDAGVRRFSECKESARMILKNYILFLIRTRCKTQ